MKDILIIAQFISTKYENGNGRFTYLADLLAQDNEVEIVTTTFCHIKKTQRVIEENTNIEEKYKLTMLNEPGYKKNICLKRFYSHFKLSKNLQSYLEKRKNPDIIYCAVPSLDVAYIAAKYAKENKIKFIIDIQDLWPEAFRMILNIPIISDSIFYPMEKKANMIYSVADKVVAVSDTYRDRGLKVNNKDYNGLTVFLGTDLEKFDKVSMRKKIEKIKGEFWVTYIGTLGHSYDIKIIMDALYMVKSNGINNIRFMIIGDGPLREEFEEYSKEKKIECTFTGMLSYEDMIGYIVCSDLAVNPIRKGAAQSIINKVGDYAAAGLPVLSTQECREYKELVERYNIGFNCLNDDCKDIAEKLERLYKNEDIRKDMGFNNRRLAEEKFDRRVTYNRIVDLINDIN